MKEHDDLSEEIRHLAKAIANLTAALVNTGKPKRTHFDVRFSKPVLKTKPTCKK